MNDDNLLGGVLGQLGQTAKKTVQQVVKLPAVSAEGSGEPKQEKKQEWQSDEERIKFLKGLYGSDKNANPNPQPGKKPTDFEKQIVEKSPEEQKKLLELRDQLHKENYYNPTFNPVKQQEERPAEKVEKEKKMEALELEKKEKNKPPPLAVVREQNKAEMFRGAAG